MQRKRINLAIILSIIVFLIYTEIVIKPSLPKPNVKESQPVQDLTKFKEPDSEEQITSFANNSGKTISDIANSKKYQIETNLFTALLSKQGGRLTSFKLKKHKKNLESNDLVELIESDVNDFPLAVTIGTVSDIGVDYNFNVKNFVNNSDTFNLDPNQQLTIELAGEISPSVLITKNITFSGNSYLIEVDLKSSKVSSDGTPLQLNITKFFDPTKAESSYNPKVLTTYDSNQSIKHIASHKIAKLTDPVQARWLTFGDNYFQIALINRLSASNALVSESNKTVNLKLAGEANRGKFAVYLGPKTETDLKSSGYQLERSIDLGWFGFIGQPILRCLNLLNKFLGNYGLAIIVFTILLRILLLPLTKATLLSMRKMQTIQPEMSAIRTRVKDPQQQQVEMFALYKKHGINPLGGCFPMLIQLPILLGVFNALRISMDLRHAPFALWVNDLSAPEKLNVFGIPIPFMALLMGISMIVQQLLTPTPVSDPAQKRIMYMMPVIFTIMFVIFPFPAGLTLYWLVSNILSIIQNTAIKSDKDISPTLATIIAGVVVYAVGYGLTLI